MIDERCVDIINRYLRLSDHAKINHGTGYIISSSKSSHILFVLKDKERPKVIGRFTSFSDARCAEAKELAKLCLGINIE